jgi:CheY-like chemotaxis protein
MHGREVLEALREDEVTADVPVVVISATAAGQEAELVLEQGAIAFEPKPIDVQRLFRALSAALGTARVG